MRRLSSLREIQAGQAWLALAAGDLDRVERWQASLGLGSNLISLAQEERETLIIARLHLVKGDPEATLRLLAGRQSDAHARGRIRSEIEILCLEAMAHAAGPDPDQAEQCLVQALALAQPGALCRVFLDQGEPMAVLLQATVPRLARRSLAVYAAALRCAGRNAAAGRVCRGPVYRRPAAGPAFGSLRPSADAVHQHSRLGSRLLPVWPSRCPQTSG